MAISYQFVDAAPTPLPKVIAKRRLDTVSRALNVLAGLGGDPTQQQAHFRLGANGLFFHSLPCMCASCCAGSSGIFLSVLG